MQFPDFKRVVTSFADQSASADFDHGNLTMIVRDEIIEARIQQRPDGIRVESNGAVMSAEQWIREDLAKLPLLAERIYSLVSPPDSFVAPSGAFLDRIEKDPIGRGGNVANALEEMRRILDERPAGMTSVLYLTSEAGKGKTSLIEKVAVDQALSYKRKASKWLLLPVPLGGRPFLRFDDAVVAALSNTFRFPFLYYSAFLELVRLGALVPAFDGFEEMIVDTKSGDALSAFGNLVNELHSGGTLLVAARRAFFDLSFGAQTRLWDAVRRERDVALQRLSLNRWNRDVFLRYAEIRKVRNPRQLYEQAVARLTNKEHPVLTRAVLIKRLVDVAKESDDLTGFLARIGESQTDYFHDFVGTIVEREVKVWKNTGGHSDHAWLLSLEEHHEMLSLLAYEMWLSSSEALGLDVVRLVLELFAEAKAKPPTILRQVRDRIADHSLLRSVKTGGRALVSFDHEDFRAFYLGQALGRALAGEDSSTVKSILDMRTLTAPVISEAARYVVKDAQCERQDVLAYLQLLLEGTLPVSFSRENAGMLMLAIIHDTGEQHRIDDISFAIDALRERRLSNLKVSDCYFASTRLDHTELVDCSFVDCRFERLIVERTECVDNTKLVRCHVDSIALVEGENREDRQEYFTPSHIDRELERAGFTVVLENGESGEMAEVIENEEDLELTEKFLRMFLRSTSLSEPAIHTRLGTRSGHFLNNVLPALRQAEVIRIDGNPNIMRVRLVKSMSKVQSVLGKARGSFSRFVTLVEAA